MQQFVRVQQGNAVIPGLISDGGLLDLRSLVSDITPETIASGVLTRVNAAALKPLAGEVRYLAPISGVGQISATGFNYKKHIEEMKVPTPTEPEVFLKSMLSLTGPFDPISRGPNQGVKLDWETELAIVVGREVQDIKAEEAASPRRDKDAHLEARATRLCFRRRLRQACEAPFFRGAAWTMGRARRGCQSRAFSGVRRLLVRQRRRADGGWRSYGCTMGSSHSSWVSVRPCSKEIRGNYN
jgi:hypothetical protein